MSVLTYDSNDLFIYRVMKSHENNPDDIWVNTYEFRATESGSETILLDLGVKLIAFERAIHMVSTEFRRLVISTWEEDSVPYDPASFISSTISGVGLTGEVNGAVPINICMSVARTPASGRQGHVFYRGALDMAEIENPAGKWTFIDQSEIQTRIEEALTSSGLDEFIGIDGGLEMVMINKTGLQVRRVVGLVAAGVSTLPTDHKWFNRTSP